MPLYDYVCAKDGEFREFNSMAAFADPVPCPNCGVPAPRSVSMPNIPILPSTTRRAHEINERSANEPRVARKRATHRHDHGTIRTPLGTGLRHAGNPRYPWMVGH